MLAEAYYPDHVAMPSTLYEPLRAMYDLITADADWLSGPTVEDVTWSFCGGINDTVLVRGAPTSVEPEAGQVWTRVTCTDQGLVVHLINLLWIQDDHWDAIHEEAFAPTPSIQVTIEWNHPVSAVLVQRAEEAIWRAQVPVWVDHIRGKALSVMVPSFDIWAMVVVPYDSDRA